jgi:hypothetical protein
MLGFLREKLTFSNVVALVALFVALRGAAYAAIQLPKNSVGTKQLRKGAVTKVKIKPATVKALRGATGPAGPPGPVGPAGERCPQASPCEAPSRSAMATAPPTPPSTSR